MTPDPTEYTMPDPYTNATYFAKMHDDLVQMLRSPTLPRKTRRQMARVAAVDWRECAILKPMFTTHTFNRASRRAAMQGDSRKLSDFGLRDDAVRGDAQRRAHARMETRAAIAAIIDAPVLT